MSSPQRSAGRRVAERPPSRFSGIVKRLRTGRNRFVTWAWPTWALALLAALVMVACSVFGVGPGWLDQAAAVTISTAFAIALSARAGGRPIVFGFLALVLGAAAVVCDLAVLRTGAAVMTATVASVLAVMATVPAVRFRHAVREAGVAVLISAVGAFAVVGFRPVVAVHRFDYVALALSFLLASALVYNLGAGLHGLGKRGALVVLVGTAGIAVTLAYAELLRRYGAESLVDDALDGVRWMRSTLGAAPRPIQMLVGVPAIVWGCHVRARRRQGWWVCAFGVALTTSVSGLLVNPLTSWLEALLIVVYSVLPGLALGYAVIRVDLALTGPRGQRARRAEEQTALRPEPARFQALL